MRARLTISLMAHQVRYGVILLTALAAMAVKAVFVHKIPTVTAVYEEYLSI